MSKLLIATTNPAKAREYREFLSDLGIEVLSLGDLGNFEIVEETGETFEENAILKAKEYFAQFQIPTLADDGGLMIDALAGEPGVKSHRWLGRLASDEELAKQALERMQGVPKERRNAILSTFVVFYDGANLLIENEAVRGYITEEYPGRMEKGFPWRAVLVVKEFGKLYQDLTPAEHEQINHRRKIIERLKPRVKEALAHWESSTRPWI